jgi:glycosyltransferase involved in cell wall biosynthesis
MQNYILHIPSWFPNEDNPYSGNFIEKHIKAISKYMPSISLKVVARTKSHRKIHIKYLSENNISVEYCYHKTKGIIGKIKSKILRYFLYKKTANYIVKKFGKPVMIHLHVAYPMGNFAVNLSKKWKVPLVLSELWSLYLPQNQQNIKRKLKKHLNKVFKNIEAFTCVSKILQENISKIFPEKKSEIIPNVVDTDLFTTGNNYSKKLKILHVSTLIDEVKNISGILRATHLLSRQRTDFELNIINENQNIFAEDFVKENNLENFVHFLGKKTEKEVAQIMKEHSFLLMFSNFETQSIVILEAQSAGIPVLATYVGGIPEILNTERGCFVKAKDENELREKMNWMLDNCKNFDKEKLRKFVMDFCSQEIVGQKFKNFYILMQK